MYLVSVEPGYNQGRRRTCFQDAIARKDAPMTAERLNELYQSELMQSLEPPLAPFVNPRSTRRILVETQRREPGLWQPDRPAWVWSDLHLHHKNIIRYCDRPFATVDDMDEHLHREWRHAVGDDECILCGGDVAFGHRLNLARRELLASAPGKKMLVIGNHDFWRGEVKTLGFDEAWMALVVKTDPPLLVTHLPLRTVPPGTVNVHGHVHNHPLGQGRHINICVEHTEYRPLPLEALVRLAETLVEGRVPDGETTVERLRTIAALD